MTTQRNHHNTTHLAGEVLHEADAHALSQQTRILHWFQENWHREVTPCQVQQLVMPEALIGSVRRAISNLTEAGELERTTNKRTGAHGSECYLWRLK